MKSLIASAALVAILAAGLPYLTRVAYPVHTSGTVVVTGASSGIGRHAAVHLARMGYRVYAGVRKPSDAESLKEEEASLVPVILDVTDQAQIDEVYKQLLEDPSPLIGLVNNAGRGGALAPIEYSGLQNVRDIFDTNYFGAIAMTQKLLPLLKKNKGRVINMSSIGGMARIQVAMLWAYSNSKVALEAFSDALRKEMRRFEVSVSIIQPGFVKTAIFGKSGIEDDGTPPPKEHWYEEYKPEYDLTVTPFFLAPKHGADTSVTTEAIVHALTETYPQVRYPVSFAIDGKSGQKVPASVLSWVGWLLSDRLIDLTQARKA